MTSESCVHNFYRYLVSVFTNKDHPHRQTAHCPAGLHIWMPVCTGSVLGGLALCWLCPDIHSHTLSAVKKGMHHTPPSRLIKEGCATLLWAYFQGYQHENTTSQSSAGGRSVIVSCQTSKVLLTASYLTFSSNEFIFLSLVFWQCCHLWPNIAPSSHHVYCEPMIKECENCTLYEERKRKLPLKKKVQSD